MKKNKQILFLLLWLAVGSAAPSIRAYVSNYFPLEKGNYWIYTPDNNHDRLRMEVVRRTDNIAEVTLAGGLMVFRVRDSEIDIQLPQKGFVLYSRFVQGSTWDRLPGDPSICNRSVVSVAPVLEPVVTPAGTFVQCLYFKFQNTCVDAGTMDEWWAPAAGLVKFRVNNIAGAITYELSEYSVRGPKGNIEIIRGEKGNGEGRN